MTTMVPPLDYVPTDPPAPNPYPRRAIKRGLIAASVAAAMAAVVCFFPVASIAIVAMVSAFFAGEKFCQWFDSIDEVEDDYS